MKTLEYIWLAGSIAAGLLAVGFIVRSRLAKTLTRSSAIVPVLVAVLATGSAAYAWSVLTGGSGSSGGTIATATVSNAVNIEQPTDTAIQAYCTSAAGPCSVNTGTIPRPVDPGGTPVDVFFGIKNLSGVAETVTIDPTKVTFSGTGSSGGDCGAHLHLGALSSPMNTGQVPKIPDTSTGWYDDGNGGVILGFKAAMSGDSSMPVDCSNATFTINVPTAAVTTQP